VCEIYKRSHTCFSGRQVSGLLQRCVLLGDSAGFTMEKEGVVRLRARWDFAGVEADDLPLKKGDIIELVERTDSGWWRVRPMAGRLTLHFLRALRRFPRCTRVSGEAYKLTYVVVFSYHALLTGPQLPG